MKYKLSKIEIVAIVLAFPLFLFLVTTLLSGIGTVTYNGFAFDREGNLYLGRKYRIDVLNIDGEVINSINARATMRYDFTISDETIIVCAGTSLFWMDLQGTPLKEELQSRRWKQIIPPGEENIFVDDNGTKYTMGYSGFLRSTIYRWDGDQKTEVCKTPLIDYITRLVLLFAVCGYLFMLPYCFNKANKCGLLRTPFNLYGDPHKL